jgi:hypothetical protein
MPGGGGPLIPGGGGPQNPLGGPPGPGGPLKGGGPLQQQKIPLSIIKIHLVMTKLPLRSTRVHPRFLVGFVLLDLQFYVYVL